MREGTERKRKKKRKKKEKTSDFFFFFFVLRCRSQAPAHWSCCPVSLAPGSLSFQGFQKAPTHRSGREGTLNILCPQALVPRTRSPVPLPCLPSTGVPVPSRLPKSTRQKERKKRGKTRDFFRPQVLVSGTHPPVPQGKMRDILCPQVPVPGTRSPVPPPCLPSTGVPVPLRLPKSARQEEKKKEEKRAISSVLRHRSQAPAHRYRREKCGIFFVLRRRSQAPAHRSRHPASLATGARPFKASKKHSPKKTRSGFFPPAGSRGKGRSGPAGPGLVSYPLHKALGSCRCGCGLDVVLCPVVSILGRFFFVIFS